MSCLAKVSLRRPTLARQPKQSNPGKANQTRIAWLEPDPGGRSDQKCQIYPETRPRGHYVGSAGVVIGTVTL